MLKPKPLPPIMVWTWPETRPGEMMGSALSTTMGLKAVNRETAARPAQRVPDTRETPEGQRRNSQPHEDGEQDGAGHLDLAPHGGPSFDTVDL